MKNSMLFPYGARNFQLTPWAHFFMDLEDRDTMNETMDPGVEIEDLEHGYFVRFDMPGVRREDIKVHIENNELIVSGERKIESERKDGSSYYKKYQRAISLGDNVDTDNIEAIYKDGVLTVALLKHQSKIPKTITVKEDSDKQEGSLFSRILKIGKTSHEASRKKEACSSETVGH